MSCYPSNGQLSNPINFTIFNKGSNSVIANPAVSITKKYNLSKETDEPCIALDVRGCYYTVVVYELNNYELPPSATGYTISYQRCCRVANMQNLLNSEFAGNTYSISIPGTNSTVKDAIKNSSPEFLVNDTGFVCGGAYFTYPFSATDKDGDELSYSLCSAYTGGTATFPAPNPADAPPYSLVDYISPYSGSKPMGPNVTINALTGLISGISPIPNISGSEFVITVCVTETRAGKYVGESRKELLIQVKDCLPITAKLAPKATTCDGFSVNFSNSVTNPSGILYTWDFGNPLSGLDNGSSLANPNHTFTDIGEYKVKLTISLGGFCTNADSILVKVYPGFFPDFKADGTFCKGTPFEFLDNTTTSYGDPTGWRWNFGNPTAINDTSIIKNPSYTYLLPGTYQAKLIVSSTFGCTDSVMKSITIKNGPSIDLSTHDTLICSIDTLQLKTSSTGNFVWSPDYIISSINSPNPLVSPDIPTKYFVSVTDAEGCKNSDSVFVDVKQFVTTNAGNDTTICTSDEFRLNTISDALSFIWIPATYLSSTSIKNPIATPLVPSITYTVIGNIGKCQSQDQITILTAPLPKANIGKDTLVCFNTTVPLRASGGSIYTWTPSTYLTANNIANPLALAMLVTTQYKVEIRDTLGCNKSVFDSILIKVEPILKADAGPADTSVVLGEPLFLNGSGGATYLWQPTNWLNNPTISNPIANPQDNITYQLTVTNSAGCKATDNIRVNVYKIAPGFYVPRAFTPNNDGNNDLIRPILMGMRSLKLFKVYNRWGQLLFSTSEIGKGWDGTFRGNQQDPGTYVWMAEGETYLGQVIKKQGTVVLLR